MNTLYLLAGLPVAALAAWELYRHIGPKAAERAPSKPKADTDWIAEGKCPDCHQASLLEGPHGGMSQNIGCESCHMEFNVGFGFGTGPFMVDRTGKMSVGRAAVFGITPAEYEAAELRRQS